MGTTLPRLPSTLPKRTAAKGSCVLVADGQHRELGDALARAHDRARVDGLVGGDVHEAAAVVGRDLRQRPRAEHVRLHGFGRVRLEDRNVLVRGGVEHDVGLVALEHFAQPALVADVGEDRLGLVERRHHLEQQAVVAVEQEQAGGAVLRDLAGDLAADRSTGAGHENDRALEVVGDVARVGGCVLAARGGR